jgi:hypothetical protein
MLLLIGICPTMEAASARRTFYKDVLPILENRCQECHRRGEIAPMPLMTYEETRPWAKAIREAVLLKKMPPWFAEPGHARLADQRALSPEETGTILSWVDQGALQGNPAEARPPRQFSDGWRLGKPDAVLEMAEEFHIPATGTVKYQYIPVAANFTEDKWVQAAEVRPGDRTAVHHILIYVREPGSEFVRGPKGESILETTPPDHSKAPPDDGIGALETGGPSGASMLTLYVPGGDYMRLEPGQAMLIKKGSDLIFQIHYTTAGKPKVDRSRIGLVFAKGPPERRVAFLGLSNRTMRIPPGAGNHRITNRTTLPETVRLISILPHMHVRGKGYEIRAIYPGGESETLLKVPRYDFNWQLSYFLAEPRLLPKGTRLESSAYFDNSSNNPANPDPTAEVFWGEQTWEEMNTGFLNLELPADLTPEELARRAQAAP